MKKTIILITIVIFIISCKVTTTAPENQSLINGNNYKSSFPVLGTAYLWVLTEQGGKISLKFGPDGTAPANNTGEIIFDKNNGIDDTMLSTDKNNTNTYAFQTGTLTGSVEVLDKTRIKVYFTQNVTPYIKIMEAVCEKK